MKKVLLFSLLTTFVSCITNILFSQTLEEVELQTGPSPVNTYLTDINDAGFVTGYCDTTGGATVGFVINPNGKIRYFMPLPGNSTKVESINNHNVIVINNVMAGVNTTFKAYYNAVTEDYQTPVIVTGIGQTNVQPFGINDLNDIVGWYPNLSERWLWWKRDSISVAYDAKRYFTTGPTTYYPTYAGGINNNNLVSGFFIDGSFYKSFFYNYSTNTFSLITGGTTKMKAWDVNNNNAIVGEYQQANGFWMGFWAQTVSNNITVLHSLNTIMAPTTQSVVNGVNDKLEMAGSYLNPNTGKWVGFIYRPLQNEYRLPNFEFVPHTWAMLNQNVGANAVWSNNYWGGSNYKTQDPYAPYAGPLITNYLKTKYPKINKMVRDSTTTSWKGFAEELDPWGLNTATAYLSQQYYINVAKYFIFDKWRKYIDTSFNGYCYGFSYATLQRRYDSTKFALWTGLAANENLPALQNTNNTAVKAVERHYLKQLDKSTYAKYNSVTQYTDVFLWQGLYRLKNTFNETYQNCNPRSIAISLPSPTGTGYHNLLPYKIKTPTFLPFSGVFGGSDSLFVYDSNYPGDSTQFFLVANTLFYGGWQYVFNPNYTIGYMSFNKPGIRDTVIRQHSMMKTTAVNDDDSILEFSISPYLYYNMTGPGSTQASLNATGFTSNITDIRPVQPEDIATKVPFYFQTDTTTSISYSSYNYSDSAMSWSQTSTHRSMGISRDALPGETDHSTMKYRYMTYGTHDVAAKTINGFFTQVTDDMSQGVNILVSNFGVVQGDSVITENPAPFIYKIHKIGGAASTYDLWLYVAGTDSVREFTSTGVLINGDATHTIVTYYDGPTGKQVVIEVDEGSNGSVDDTLLLANTTGLSEVFENAAYVKTYPNPVSKSLNVMISKEGKYDLSLTDLTGRIMYSKQVIANNRAIEIATESFAKGIYLLQISNAAGKLIYRDKILKE